MMGRVALLTILVCVLAALLAAPVYAQEIGVTAMAVQPIDLDKDLYTASALTLDFSGVPVIGPAIGRSVDGALILAHNRYNFGVVCDVAAVDDSVVPVTLGGAYIQGDGACLLVSAILSPGLRTSSLAEQEPNRPLVTLAVAPPLAGRESFSIALTCQMRL